MPKKTWDEVLQDGRKKLEMDLATHKTGLNGESIKMLSNELNIYSLKCKLCYEFQSTSILTSINSG